MVSPIMVGPETPPVSVRLQTLLFGFIRDDWEMGVVIESLACNFAKPCSH